MLRISFSLLITVVIAHASFAEDSQSEAEQWDKKYEQLLKDRPAIREKVESGGATKADVIAWMKKGGDRQDRKRGKNYDGARIQVKDPSEFQSSQEKVIYSGPQAGEQLPSFTATGLRGERKGEEYDPVAIADGKPHVLIFQDNSVVGQKGLLLCGGVLATIARMSPSDLYVSATFLVDDPTPSKIFEYDFMHEINNVIDMSVSHDRRDGPGAYGLNRNVAMTIIVAREGKVLHNFALRQPMLYPDPYVMGAIADAVGVDRSTLADWFKEGKATKVAMRMDEKKEVISKTQNRDGDGSDRVARSREQGARERQSRQRPEIQIKDPTEFAKTQDKKLFSGPQPGETLPAITVIGVRGDLRDKEFDPVAEAKGRPQVLVFQDESGVGLRGMIGFARIVAQVAERSSSGLQYATVFLGDDPGKLSEFAMKVDQHVPEFVTMGVSKDGRDGPGAYGLDRNVSMTILIAKDAKVTHNFAFPQSMLYPDPHVLGAMAEVLGEERETVAAWLSESRENRSMMRRDTDAGQSGTTRRHVELRRRLGALVEAGKLTREEAAELFTAAFPPEENSK